MYVYLRNYLPYRPNKCPWALVIHGQNRGGHLHREDVHVYIGHYQTIGLSRNGGQHLHGDGRFIGTIR